MTGAANQSPAGEPAPEVAPASAFADLPGPEFEQARRRTLLAQIAWFNRLRFLAVIGVAATAFVAGSPLGLLTTNAAIFGLCAVLGAVDLAYFAWYRRLAVAPLGALRRHVDLQIAIDLIVLTLLLWESGGIGNPFVLF